MTKYENRLLFNHMETVGEHLRLGIDRRLQRDRAILDTIRYGLLIKKLRGEVSDEELAFTRRIDEAREDFGTNVFDLSREEAALAVGAIETNNKQEKQLNGALVLGQSISAQDALAEIRAFAQ